MTNPHPRFADLVIVAIVAAIVFAAAACSGPGIISGPPRPRAQDVDAGQVEE